MEYFFKALSFWRVIQRILRVVKKPESLLVLTGEYGMAALPSPARRLPALHYTVPRLITRTSGSSGWHSADNKSSQRARPIRIHDQDQRTGQYLVGLFINHLLRDDGYNKPVGLQFSQRRVAGEYGLLPDSQRPPTLSWNFLSAFENFSRLAESFSDSFSISNRFFTVLLLFGCGGLIRTLPHRQ